jgi:hypothetical protein
MISGQTRRFFVCERFAHWSLIFGMEFGSVLSIRGDVWVIELVLGFVKLLVKKL